MIPDTVETKTGKKLFIIDDNKKIIVETYMIEHNGICFKSNSTCPCSSLTEQEKCLYNLYGELLI